MREGCRFDRKDIVDQCLGGNGESVAATVNPTPATKHKASNFNKLLAFFFV